MKRNELLFLFMLFTLSAYANDSIPPQIKEKEYSFIIQDSPATLFTMRQSNENCLSIYRLAINALNKSVPPKASLIAQGVGSLFFITLTHEEGHRSILTYKNIGSISKPYFNSKGAAYVTGVTDADLKLLRDTDLPDYIRLHTAGLEADYSMLLKESSLLNWQEEDKQVLWVEYVMRKLSLVAYYSFGLLKYDADLKEESNERNRDIVGHDVYGAIRHLHRPDMNFYRYTQYSDLTKEERHFVKRVGWRSLLNLIDPVIIGKTGFVVNANCNINFNLGYGMAPFGDFIDQNFWIRNNHVRAHFYLRQFENKNTWFPAFGGDFSSIKFFKDINIDMAFHCWRQPDSMSFTQSSGEIGGAIDVLCRYYFPFNKKHTIKGLSLNVGILAKTKGFLLEEMSLDNHIGLRFGTSFRL